MRTVRARYVALQNPFGSPAAVPDGTVLKEDSVGCGVVVKQVIILLLFVGFEGSVQHLSFSERAVVRKYQA